MKICMVASSGGHWNELLQLKSFDELYSTFYITEGDTIQENKSENNIYYYKKIDRKEKKFILNFIKLFIYANRILKREKPNVVLTTGSLLSYPFCLLGKIYGCKIIYIESYARIYNKSLTGKLIYPIANLFIVQWKELCSVYPKAKYWGKLF